MRRFSRFRRFSATPRRTWFKRRPLTVEPGRLQQAQVLSQYDFVLPAPSTAPDYFNHPTFNIQALTPWVNASASGYDRALEIKGIIWDLNAIMLSHDTGAGEVPGPISEAARAFANFHANFFVDQAEADSGAPVSHLEEPYGPFYTTAPTAAPNFNTSDSQFPTRVIKRKNFRMKVADASTSTQAPAGAFADAGGLSRFTWSGAIRKRLSVGDRQCLYAGLYGLSPFAPGVTATVFVSIWWNINFWYSLKR